MSPARLRVSCLLLVTLATLIHLVGGSVAWQAAGIVALLLYLVTLKGQLTRMAKGLLCAAGVLTLLALWRSPTPGQLLFEASGRFAFFCYLCGGAEHVAPTCLSLSFSAPLWAKHAASAA